MAALEQDDQGETVIELMEANDELRKNVDELGYKLEQAIRDLPEKVEQLTNDKLQRKITEFTRS